MVWTSTPTKWGNGFLQNLYGYEWELTKSPGGAWQFTAKDGAGAGTIPDPFGGAGRAPTMLVTDVALREDPIYREITQRWLDHPEELSEAFAKAGTSCCTATWARFRATSGRGFPSRSCGRTRFRRSTTRWSTRRTSRP